MAGGLRQVVSDQVGDLAEAAVPGVEVEARRDLRQDVVERVHQTLQQYNPNSLPRSHCAAHSMKGEVNSPILVKLAYSTAPTRTSRRHPREVRRENVGVSFSLPQE